MEERLQKIMSRCGISSRRKAEEMIMEGLVTVNGAPATIGMKADINRDHIKVKGKLINKIESMVYLMFNKPVKCLTSMSETEKRPMVTDYLKRLKARVFPVGRLDFNSEGLLLLTNDGDFANAVLHPANKVPKTYLVKVDGMLDDKDIMKLENGIRLDDGMTAPAKVRRVQKKTKANSWIEMTIYEGRKRQIRRMLERVKHPVIKLVRTRINGIELGSLKPGAYRFLTPDELKKLQKEVLSPK
jgi:23S rRNA pseudouridine2605 synthase